MIIFSDNCHNYIPGTLRIRIQLIHNCVAWQFFICGGKPRFKVNKVLPTIVNIEKLNYHARHLNMLPHSLLLNDRSCFLTTEINMFQGLRWLRLHMCYNITYLLNTEVLGILLHNDKKKVTNNMNIISLLVCAFKQMTGFIHNTGSFRLRV